jgi:hypothetical protein
VIHVKVTKSDIRRGRTEAGCQCGCPVWYALRRSLKSITTDESELKIPHVAYAKFGKFRLIMPDDARDFQSDLMEDFSAPVEPFEFDVDVEIFSGRRAR